MVSWPLFFLAAAFARGATPPTPNVAADRDVTALAAKIDRYFATSWAAAKVRPAPPADDAEFLRRTSLKLIGRIPSVAEARSFLKDPQPDKRRRLVDRLLKSPSYVNHFATFWRTLMTPESDPNLGRFGMPGFEPWLREQVSQNVGYDQFVRNVLTAPVAEASPSAGDVFFLLGAVQEATPLGYYLAKEGKPENLAASTTRLFLGIRLECAQCHHHPFAGWKREQFWGLAAFFAGLEMANNNVRGLMSERVDRRAIAIPGTDRMVRAGFLDGTEPIFHANVSSRVALANWVTAPRNPYFARAAVNRIWAHFFGRGLTDPVDDLEGQETVAHHPRLLDDLAKEFTAHRFDLQFLMKGITASRVYQLSSAATHPSQDAPHQFARMALKGLTPEQLFDSLVQATGYQEEDNPGGFLGLGNDLRQRFLEKFANHRDQPTETATTILHALALMNGKFTADATDLANSETLAAVIDAPFLDTTGRIETLFLATLSRTPRPEEMTRLLQFVRTKEDAEDSPEALADVFWALLNSSEFVLNH
jgi:hypothetical protein